MWQAEAFPCILAIQRGGGGWGGRRVETFSQTTVKSSWPSLHGLALCSDLSMQAFLSWQRYRILAMQREGLGGGGEGGGEWKLFPNDSEKCLVIFTWSCTMLWPVHAGHLVLAEVQHFSYTRGGGGEVEWRQNESKKCLVIFTWFLFYGLTCPCRPSRPGRGTEF